MGAAEGGGGRAACFLALAALTELLPWQLLLRRCFHRVEWSLKAAAQCSQTYGLSPVCLLRVCVLREPGCEKAAEQ